MRLSLIITNWISSVRISFNADKRLTPEIQRNVLALFVILVSGSQRLIPNLPKAGAFRRFRQNFS
jgi:hypothetical protein